MVEFPKGSSKCEATALQMWDNFSVRQFAHGFWAINNFLELEAFPSRYRAAVANQHFVVKTQLVLLIMRKNFCGPFDALAS